MRRSRKLSILNEVKYNQVETDLSFPVHHKHQRQDSLSLSHQLNEIESLDVEQLISKAYDEAIRMVKHSRMLDTLNQCNIHNLNDLSEYVFHTLNKNSRMINYSLPAANTIDDEFGLDEENDDNDNGNYSQNLLDVETVSTSQNDDESDDEEDTFNSTKSEFDGIRVVDNIKPDFRQSYFKIKINDNIKYLHKQSACWLLSNNTTTLSTDRLSRVRQQMASSNK
ncbi:unnamed protein product [Adineta ricciae]|uniref:Uncharacterized protein n=1 Tax=Adineta ricciae TaxID=249248 RepID=A0A816DLC5_ADIRI|nr:unnamed protein product [Adineta ricciae]CAF1636228.1 unnamed protein product [Adineta ricciae]